MALSPEPVHRDGSVPFSPAGTTFARAQVDISPHILRWPRPYRFSRSDKLPLEPAWAVEAWAGLTFGTCGCSMSAGQGLLGPGGVHSLSQLTGPVACAASKSQGAWSGRIRHWLGAGGRPRRPWVRRRAFQQGPPPGPCDAGQRFSWCLLSDARTWVLQGRVGLTAVALHGKPSWRSGQALGWLASPTGGNSATDVRTPSSMRQLG